MDKINNLTPQNNINFSSKDTKSKYDNLEYAYYDTISKLDKSEFKNSQTRFLTELNFVIKLKNTAKEENKEQDYLNWEQKEEQIRQILKDEFGIEIDDD